MIDWAVWRVVLAQVATLREIEEHWTINDLADANEALDIKQELEAREIERAQRQR